MNAFQIESVERPLDDRSVFFEAFRVLSRAQMMGLWDPPTRVALDRDLYVTLVEHLHDAGIASGIPATRPPDDAPAWASAWRRLGDAVDESPHPSGEWNPARELLGDELLAELLDVSESSLRRYSMATRPTPDDVAWRLHAIVQITSALAGSYNGYGIRRWFARERTQLDGLRPKDLLAGPWAPENDGARRVIGLAEALVGAGSAS